MSAHARPFLQNICDYFCLLILEEGHCLTPRGCVCVFLVYLELLDVSRKPRPPPPHYRCSDFNDQQIFFFFLQFSSVVQCGVGVVSPVSAPSLIVVEGLRGQESFDKRHGG